MSARDPNVDVEISGCSDALRAYVAGLEFTLARTTELRAHAVTAAGDAIEARELAYRERDAAARELVAVLAGTHEAPPTESPDGLDLARRAVDLWGTPKQLDQAIEECAELILSIRHQRRGRVGLGAVADEVIDVEFMCKQLRVIIGSLIMEAAETHKIAKVIRKVTEAEAKRGGETTP